MFLRIFQHLLPTAKAWLLTPSKQLREFFDGLTSMNSDVKEYSDSIFEDIDPYKTRELPVWEQQFGLRQDALDENERRDRLDATWKATGGQSPKYIQDTLRAAGFDVYVHEWWDPNDVPAPNQTDHGPQSCLVPRDPFYYLRYDGDVLSNKIIKTVPDYISYCGSPVSYCGEPEALCGNFINYKTIEPENPIPTDPTKWPYFLYIGNEVLSETAVDWAWVPPSRREEFETLCLKLCPAHLWLGMQVRYISLPTLPF